MKLFSYTNNKNGYYKDGKFVEPFFTYAADTMDEANQKVLEVFGIDVVKTPYIGVSISTLDENY